MLATREGFTFSLERLQPRRRTRRHEHGQARMCVLLRGDVAEERPRREEFAAGDLLYRPADIRHVNEYGRTAPLVLRIDIEERALDVDRSPRLREPQSLRSPDIASLVRQACEELQSTDGAAPLALDAIGAELVGWLSQTRGRGRPHWLAEVAERLRMEYRTDHRLGALARDVGVHPAHLAERFRASYGRSIGAYLRRVRVAVACRALETGAESLADVAARAGFYDQSHMTRHFKREFGITPGGFRRRRHSSSTRK